GPLIDSNRIGSWERAEVGPVHCIRRARDRREMELFGCAEKKLERSRGTGSGRVEPNSPHDAPLKRSIGVSVNVGPIPNEVTAECHRRAVKRPTAGEAKVSRVPFIYAPPPGSHRRRIRECRAVAAFAGIRGEVVLKLPNHKIPRWVINYRLITAKAPVKRVELGKGVHERKARPPVGRE